MSIILSIIQVLAAILGSVAAVMTVILFVRLRWPAPVLWFLKLCVSALAPWLGIGGILVAIIGLATGSVFTTWVGVYDALIFLMFTYRVTSPPHPSRGFEKVFGPDWEARINAGQKKYFLPARTTFRLPAVPNPWFAQNIAFTTVPGTGRQLLCDIWQPAENVNPSGVALIYLHGSAFYFLDKDLGTRPFFRHLAAQGHVIMDVAYRLGPETDVMGMVHDVKRAIHWMKDHARIYGINPDRVVVGGASAGGHLALLTAYTVNNPAFTPADLAGKDTSVCAVMSLYGTSNMADIYYHTNQHLTTRATPGRPKKVVPTKMPAWIVRSLGDEYHRLGLDKGFENAGALAPILGGHPDEVPETYALYSVITHVHAGCPPTYLIHGEHDIMAPVTSTRTLYGRLVKEQVPVVMHILPQTDHAFDVILPKISPAAHTEFYEVERFLALQAVPAEKPGRVRLPEEHELIY